MSTVTALLTSVVALAAATGVAAFTTHTTAAGTEQARIPVLVELFTSEGCSSCPPADELLRQLLRNQPVPGVEVVAISEHVDYWNRLGWRDPFSSAQYSERQSDYARALGSAQVYTPQLVVDGQRQVIGNDSAAVRGALAAAVATPRARVSVGASRSGDGKTMSIRVLIDDLSAEVAAGDPSIDVLVAVVEDGLTSNVSRGENARRELHHDAVARLMNRLGTVSTSAPTAELSGVVELPQGSRGPLRVIAFLQRRAGLQVVGVAASRLN